MLWSKRVSAETLCKQVTDSMIRSCENKPCHPSPAHLIFEQSVEQLTWAVPFGARGGQHWKWETNSSLSLVSPEWMKLPRWSCWILLIRFGKAQGLVDCSSSELQQIYLWLCGANLYRGGLRAKSFVPAANESGRLLKILSSGTVSGTVLLRTLQMWRLLLGFTICICIINNIK